MGNQTNETVSHDAQHFARLSLKARMHAAVLSTFVGRCVNDGFTLEALSARLGEPMSDIGELLNSPESWTLDTVSDLLLAMGCELGPIGIQKLFFTAPPQAALRETP